MEEKKEEIDIREIAEAHWKYTSEVIQGSLKSICIFKSTLEINLEDYLELLHFLYVEAMVHGIGHGIEIERNRKNLK